MRMELGGSGNVWGKSFVHCGNISGIQGHGRETTLLLPLARIACREQKKFRNGARVRFPDLRDRIPAPPQTISSRDCGIFRESLPAASLFVQMSNDRRANIAKKRTKKNTKMKSFLVPLPPFYYPIYDERILLSPQIFAPLYTQSMRP